MIFPPINERARQILWPSSNLCTILTPARAQAGMSAQSTDFLSVSCFLQSTSFAHLMQGSAEVKDLMPASCFPLTHNLSLRVLETIWSTDLKRAHLPLQMWQLPRGCPRPLPSLPEAQIPSVIGSFLSVPQDPYGSKC